MQCNYKSGCADVALIERVSSGWIIGPTWYLLEPMRATGVSRPSMSANRGKPVALESSQSSVNSPISPIWLTIVASPVVKYFRSIFGLSQEVAKQHATRAAQTVTNNVRDMLARRCSVSRRK